MFLWTTHGNCVSDQFNVTLRVDDSVVTSVVSVCGSDDVDSSSYVSSDFARNNSLCLPPPSFATWDVFPLSRCLAPAPAGASERTTCFCPATRDTDVGMCARCANARRYSEWSGQCTDCKNHAAQAVWIAASIASIVLLVSAIHASCRHTRGTMEVTIAALQRLQLIHKFTGYASGHAAAFSNLVAFQEIFAACLFSRSPASPTVLLMPAFEIGIALVAAASVILVIRNKRPFPLCLACTILPAALEALTDTVTCTRAADGSVRNFMNPGILCGSRVHVVCTFMYCGILAGCITTIVISVRRVQNIMPIATILRAAEQALLVVFSAAMLPTVDRDTRILVLMALISIGIMGRLLYARVQTERENSDLWLFVWVEVLVCLTAVALVSRYIDSDLKNVVLGVCCSTVLGTGVVSALRQQRMLSMHARRRQPVFVFGALDDDDDCESLAGNGAFPLTQMAPPPPPRNNENTRRQNNTRFLLR